MDSSQCILGSAWSGSEGLCGLFQIVTHPMASMHATCLHSFASFRLPLLICQAQQTLEATFAANGPEGRSELARQGKLDFNPSPASVCPWLTLDAFQARSMHLARPQFCAWANQFAQRDLRCDPTILPCRSSRGPAAR